MASKSIQSLIDSLSHDKLEESYELPILRRMRSVLSDIKETTDDPITEEQQTEINEIEEQISEMCKSPSYKPIPFSFQKLNSITYAEGIEFFRQELNRRLNERLKNDSDGRKKALFMSIENETMLSDASSAGSKKSAESTKDTVIEMILAYEGKTESWTKDIDEDDPELQLSEEQEKDWNITSDMPEEEYITKTLAREDAIEEIKRTKKANIQEMRENEIVERREELKKENIEKLVSIMIVREINEEAQRYASLRLQDFFLWQSARNPNDIESFKRGSMTRITPKRHFSNTDEITSLRESDDDIENDLYMWMVQKYSDLQYMTPGESRRIAESDGFLPPV